MAERLARLRQPAVVVLLVVLMLRIGLALAGFVLLASSAESVEERIAAGVNAGAVATDPLTVVVLAVLVAGCVLWWPVERARTLITWSLVVVGVGVLLSLLAAVGWLVVRPAGASTLLDAAQLLLRLVLPVLALVGLARLRSVQVASGTPSITVGTSPAALERVELPVEEPDSAQEPTWRPEQAAGAAWMKAGDAAAGAAASGWGSPGDAGGWVPQSEPAQSEPARSESARSEPAQSRRDDRPPS